MAPAAGRVVGVAGGGLQHASWAANAAVAAQGREGEKATGAVLDRLAALSTGPTVLHDLAIPIPGIRANIDHAVVSGRRILLIDSKRWAPGRYWTWGRTTRRGWNKFAHASSATPTMAADAIERLCTRSGVGASVLSPLVVIWPSSGSIAFTHFRFLGLAKNAGPDTRPPAVIKSVPGAALTRTVRRILGRSALRTPADPQVVALLAPLAGALDRTSDFRPGRSGRPAGRAGQLPPTGTDL